MGRSEGRFLLGFGFGRREVEWVCTFRVPGARLAVPSKSLPVAKPYANQLETNSFGKVMKK